MSDLPAAEKVLDDPAEYVDEPREHHLLVTSDDDNLDLLKGVTVTLKSGEVVDVSPQVLDLPTQEMAQEISDLIFQYKIERGIITVQEPETTQE